MATVLELAMLSDAVYGDGGALPPGWHPLGVPLDANKSGYIGQAYIKGGNTAEIVIANKGTSTLKDLWSDIQLTAR